MPYAKKYFANILLLYSPLILKLIEKVTDLGLAFDMICPDHGILWRKDPSKIITAYAKWSHQLPEKKAVIVYDTMWNSTQMMAEAIATGLHSQNVAAKPMHLRKWHRSDIMTEVLDAKAVMVGSPTLNNGLYPTVSDFLTYMKGLKPINKIGVAFGSYGWSGKSVQLINQEFKEMNFESIDPGLKIQFVPDSKGLEACEALGRKIGHAINS